MSTESARPQRALVVGLGVAGIASALRLSRLGWDVLVLEKAPERRRGGYFVALFGAGISAAERLGIADQIPDRTAYTATSHTVERNGRRGLGLKYSDLPGRSRMMVRGDIEDAAFNALPDTVEVRYSATPVAVRQDDGGVDVDILDKASDTIVTERFDLVIGADGLRSTVRKLAFAPENELHRLNYMIAAYSLDEAVPGFAQEDGIVMHEDGRSAWVFAFADRPPTVLLSYRTDDVDAEFTRTPIESVRRAYGPENTGETLGWLIDQFEKAPEYLFDSAEQVHLDKWHDGRVVLVGDAAWCLTLYSGMGVSTGLAGADLIGTMLERNGGDVKKALAAWEAHLRPFIAFHVKTGINQRAFFTPGNMFERYMQKALLKLARMPVAGKLLYNLKKNSKDSLMKGMDIAHVPA